MYSKIIIIPLRVDQYRVVGISYATSGYSYHRKQIIHYDAEPHIKALAQQGPHSGQYCVEMTPRGVAIVVPCGFGPYARGLAALVGLDIIITTPWGQKYTIKEMLEERGARYCESYSMYGDIQRINMDDEELAAEIMLTFDGVRLIRSKLPLRVQKSISEEVKLLEHLVEPTPA